MQIAKNRDVAAETRGYFTHFVSAKNVIFSGSVGEIHTHNVRTSSNDLLKIIVAVSCRAERGNNLRSSEPSGNA
ncbi:hypothetical protein SRABI106_03297 [Rahnella aquatilis]|nr:hypothetical protein SRABI106_03297 [Rahnella aquatilis]